jgi:two-component system OmpR family response regulator
MKKILVVDDEKDIREALASGLSRRGYAALTAGTGEEALEIVRKEQVDLVLLDIAIPGIDGYETCRRMRKEAVNKRAAVIFLTGKELEPGGILKRAEELGVSGYLVKPCTMDDMLARIREVAGE